MFKGLSFQKAIHILYAQECSQSDRILFSNLQYVSTFKEVARLYSVPLELLTVIRFLKD
ncbi:hypothetical protein [Microcoleus sp. B4-D4]|uniref:hypothetical protein n=1 Tax=Microcoleus sp. B4-D4 TaxID=2818667 RepID=UPI002FD1B851